jgi:hypothetical protein
VTALIAAGGKTGAPWTPSSLPSLLFYDNNARTAAWDSGVSTEDLTDLTTMAWVLPSTVTGFVGVIIGRGASGAEHWRTDQSTSATRGIENGANFGQRNTVFSLSTWTHVCWRYEGGAAGNSGRLRIWIDGAEVSASSYTGTIPSALTSRSGNWFVGSMSDGSSTYTFGLGGEISQSIVCGAALSDADIVAAYNYTNGLK